MGHVPVDEAQITLERLHNHPMELDLSFAEEATASLSQLPEGIYSARAFAASCLGTEVTNDDYRRIQNAIHTCGFVVPLKKGEFYVKNPDDTSGETNLERADAIVDRIAAMVEQTPNLRLGEALDYIRQEGQLLSPDKDAFPVAEAIVLRHGRLQTRQTGDEDFSAQRILKVHESRITLAATVGESLDRTIDAAPPGRTNSLAQWTKKIRSIYLYTPATMHALNEAIALDPRFLLVQLPKEEGSSPTYMIKAEEIKWPPILTVEEFCKKPVQELVERLLDMCQPCDLQNINQIFLSLTNGLTVPGSKKGEVTKALLEDPRVIGVSNRYVKILHGPKDHQMYDQFTEIVETTLQTLRGRGIKFIGSKGLSELLFEAAREAGMGLTPHAERTLQTIAHIDPRLSLGEDHKKYKIGRVVPRVAEATPVEVAEKRPSAAAAMAQVATAARVDTEEGEESKLEPTEQIDVAQSAGETPKITLKELDKDQVAAFQAVVDQVVTRYVNEGTITIFVDRLVDLAESTLGRGENKLNADERAYLENLFVRHERFEPPEDEQSDTDAEDESRVLRVRFDDGQSPGIVRGVRERRENRDRLKTLYLGKN